MTLFRELGECAKQNQTSDTYLFDSFPVVACDNIRISRSRLYQGESYRGYIASKRRYFYGLRLHLLITTAGQPLEFFLVSEASNDAGCLDLYDFDLPTPSRIVTPKGFTDHELEDILAPAEIELASLRKSIPPPPSPLGNL